MRTKKFRKERQYWGMTITRWGVTFALGFLGLCIFTIAIFVLLNRTNAKIVATSGAEYIPQHKLTAVMDTPYPIGSSKDGDFWLLMVVDKNLPESDAIKLVNYYEQIYRNAPSLQIDMLCDEMYATVDKFLKSKETDFERHTLYNYVRTHKTITGEQFYPTRLITPKDNPIQGTGCK